MTKKCILDLSDEDAERLESIADKINTYVSDYVEYEESHRDAGDNYAYVVAESWTDTETDQLIEGCKDNGLDVSGIDPDSLSDEVLEYFVMRPGSMLTASVGNDCIVIGSFCVTEVEVQADCIEDVSYADLMLCDEYGLIDAYVTGNGYIYQSTDAVWYAVITIDMLKTIISQLKES